MKYRNCIILLRIIDITFIDDYGRKVGDIDCDLFFTTDSLSLSLSIYIYIFLYMYIYKKKTKKDTERERERNSLR